MPRANDRAREWGAFIQRGRFVVLRHYAVVAPDEELNDDPPTIVLTWAEWVTQHDTVYGLTIDGELTVENNKDRQARQRVKAWAQSDPNVAALVRLIRLRTDD